MEIIVKRYEHFNSAMGKYITSKKHYESEMAKGGYIPFDKAQEIAEKAKEKNRKPYILSNKAKAVIEAAKTSADRKGRLHCGDRLIEGMKEVGVNFYSNNIPKHYKIDEGGFDG